MVTNRMLTEAYLKSYVDENNIVCAIGVEFFKESYAYLRSLPPDKECNISAIKKKYKNEPDLCCIVDEYNKFIEEENEKKRFSEAEIISVKIMNKKDHLKVVFFDQNNKVIAQFTPFKLNCCRWLPTINSSGCILFAEMSMERIIGDNIKKIVDFEEKKKQFEAMLIDVPKSKFVPG